MKIRNPLPLIAVLLLFQFGCSNREHVTAPQPLDPVTLGGRTFNVLAKNSTESVILLGQLHFAPTVGSSIQGTCVNGAAMTSQDSQAAET
jgi:hypothetical protein